MTKPKVDKQVYTGLCVGGPWAQQVLNSVGDRNYPVAKMQRIDETHHVRLNIAPGDEWSETRRGLYEYDVGIWWWRGWDKR